MVGGPGESDMMAEREKIVFYTPQGALSFRGTYDAAVRRLFELENQRRPQERYTVRGPGGKPFPRRGIELVLGRLYEYEREPGK